MRSVHCGINKQSMTANRVLWWERSCYGRKASQGESSKFLARSWSASLLLDLFCSADQIFFSRSIHLRHGLLSRRPEARTEQPRPRQPSPAVVTVSHHFGCRHVGLSLARLSDQASCILRASPLAWKKQQNFSVQWALLPAAMACWFRHPHPETERL